MGMVKFSSSSYDNCCCSKVNSYQEVDVNPDPFEFTLKEELDIGDYKIALINYPNCTNYEGNKILVFKGVIGSLKHWKHIDPHFTDNKEFGSPIARFRPDKIGMKYAEIFVNALVESEKPIEIPEFFRR